MKYVNPYLKTIISSSAWVLSWWNIVTKPEVTRIYYVWVIQQTGYASHPSVSLCERVTLLLDWEGRKKAKWGKGIKLRKIFSTCMKYTIIHNRPSMSSPPSLLPLARSLRAWEALVAFSWVHRRLFIMFWVLVLSEFWVQDTDSSMIQPSRAFLIRAVKRTTSSSLSSTDVEEGQALDIQDEKSGMARATILRTVLEKARPNCRKEQIRMVERAAFLAESSQDSRRYQQQANPVPSIKPATQKIPSMLSLFTPHLYAWRRNLSKNHG